MGGYRHRLMDYVREEIMPHRFCVGCGCGTVLNAFVNAVEELGLDTKKMVCVSGIGCSSWIPSPYFKSDTLHTTHGRPIAFATGVKIMRPDLTVVVIAGDDEFGRGEVTLKDMFLGSQLAAKIQDREEWKEQPAQISASRSALVSEVQKMIERHRHN